jgi:RsiW-degrading membrane proteinase PrsW (M82 family)
VGFGFSAFENLEYALTTFLNGGYNEFIPSQFAYGHAVGELAQSVVLRAVLTPFGHPLWTSLLAAALFASYRDKRFHITRTVVIAFLAVAIVHTAWDFLPAVFQLVLPFSSVTAALLTYVVYIVFGVAGALVWRNRARRANAAALDAPLVPAA